MVRRFSSARGAWRRYATVLAAVAAVSGFIGLVQGYLHIANISMPYLIPVLAIALAFGLGPAIVVSVVAFLTFNWFFVEPLHTLTVARLEEKGFVDAHGGRLWAENQPEGGARFASTLPLAPAMETVGDAQGANV